jgi:hypothetical protein
MAMATSDPKDDPNHIPVEKRLSGDYGSPLEVLADRGLSVDQKRQILGVWLEDLEAQPASSETDSVRDSVRSALASLDEEA